MYHHLSTIKIHDDPEFQGEDNCPSKHQFDTLHENEEIVSLSGITAPINMKDADDELKKLLKKFLGNDADNWQNVINEGRIAEIPFNNKSNEKVSSELRTESFFTMAYLHIFVNGSCDITIKKIRSIDYLQWVEHIFHN